jgi:hypothetical protein
MNGQFGLEFADAPLGRRKFLAFRRSQTGDQAAIYVLLPSPGIDRLIAYAQVASQIDDLAAGIEKIKRSPSKLRWVSTSSHCCLLRWTAA